MKVLKILLLIIFPLLIWGLNAHWDSAATEASTRLVTGGYVGLAFFSLLLVIDFKQRKSIDLLQVYLVGCILRVGIGGVYTGVIIGSEFAQIISTRGHLPIEKLSEGLLLMQLGSFACIMGIMLFDQRRKQKIRNAEIQIKYPPRIFLVIFAILSWIFLVLVRAGFSTMGVLGYAINLFPDAILFIFTLLVILQKKNRKAMLGIVFLIVATQFYFASGTYMREVYAFILLPILIAFGVSLNMKLMASSKLENQKIKKSSSTIGKKILIYALGAMLLSILLFIILPASTQVKKGEAKTIKEGISNVIQKKGQNDDFPDRGIYAVAFRMSVLVVAPAIIIEAVENEGFTEYSPLKNIAAALIPRALWKSKPIISKGGWFANYLNPDQIDSTSFALTPPGEFYWSYGWFGALFAMFLMGVFLRKLWMYLSDRIFSNPIAVLTFVVLCRECVRWFESEASRPISLLLLLAILTFVSEQFFRKRRQA